MPLLACPAFCGWAPAGLLPCSTCHALRCPHPSTFSSSQPPPAAAPPALPAPCVQFAFDLAEAESGRADARCTVMIRNCPNKYSQEMMLSILEKSGFR